MRVVRLIERHGDNQLRTSGPQRLRPGQAAAHILQQRQAALARAQRHESDEELRETVIQYLQEWDNS